VFQGADPNASVIGRELAAVAGQVTINISVQSPAWAEFDVIEVFANDVPELGVAQTALLPVKCYVLDPEALGPNDPCSSAPLGAEVMTVDTVVLSPGHERFEAEVTLTVAADDPIHPDGGTGQDAWLVVRARGNRGIYPLLLNGVLSSENLATLVSGDGVEALLLGNGVPASAFTAPIYLDLDGGGYRAPFAPE
jgi:hypothetical protein